MRCTDAGFAVKTFVDLHITQPFFVIFPRNKAEILHHKLTGELLLHFYFSFDTSLKKWCLLDKTHGESILCWPVAIDALCQVWVQLSSSSDSTYQWITSQLHVRRNCFTNIFDGLLSNNALYFFSCYRFNSKEV